jgi:hypothetical protein
MNRNKDLMLQQIQYRISPNTKHNINQEMVTELEKDLSSMLIKDLSSKVDLSE